MSDQLKSCPFCGSTDMVVVGDARLYAAKCECGVTGRWEFTEAEAVAAWNRRANRLQPQDGVESDYWYIGFCSQHKQLSCYECGAALKASGWISVTERTPPDNRDVLVMWERLEMNEDGSRDKETGVLIGSYDPYDPTEPPWYDERGLLDERGVTHWQPLPEPPSIESDDDEE